MQNRETLFKRLRSGRGSIDPVTFAGMGSLNLLDAGRDFRAASRACALFTGLEEDGCLSDSVYPKDE